MHECHNFRGISLLSLVGILSSRILINKTYRVISEVQSGFRTGRGYAGLTCISPTCPKATLHFSLLDLCEKYLKNGKDVYFAFLDLDKTHDS